MIGSLQAATLSRGYASGAVTPADVVAEVYDRIAARGADAVWITLVDRAVALAAARELPARFPGPDRPLLYGLPFAVKDNIDIVGLPTTAACPDFAHLPDSTAPVVSRVLAAGGILIGKTNLDQFATGLSGTRSPYGIVANPFNAEIIAGGSSSGSAVAVAAGLVTFALGTDTAGSGRVPAGLTGTVGVKPSRGLVSTGGIVPACRSLDCPSIFVLSAADGAAVLAEVAGPDPDDPYSRPLGRPGPVPAPVSLADLRIGVPAGLEVGGDFGGDGPAAAAFAGAVAQLAGLGAQLVPVDLGPFLAVGELLYDGPWLAERTLGIEEFLAGNAEGLHPVTREVFAGAGRVSGAAAFRGLADLATGRKRTAGVWNVIDALMVPTAPTAPTIQAMISDPIATNTMLGRFTNFVNLLDLAAISVPASISEAGLPRGVTFLAPAGGDGLLLAIGAAWQANVGLPLGVAGHDLETPADDVAPPGRPMTIVAGPDEVHLAVVGAHLQGEPLHADLLRLGAHLAARIPTAAEYRLYALPSGPGQPRRPGLVREPQRGAGIAAEVYRIPTPGLGRLLAQVPAPLGIGHVHLADGSQVLGFLCEQAGVRDAVDVTEYGGWRAYLASHA